MIHAPRNTPWRLRWNTQYVIMLTAPGLNFMSQSTAEHSPVINRAFYSARIGQFLDSTSDYILGVMAANNAFTLDSCQRDAWQIQIQILQDILSPYHKRGAVHLEYNIPRLGKRIDVLALIDQVIFVLEFKVGETEFQAHAIDQVWDYALDLKNFHETSHHCPIAPILVATKAADSPITVTMADDDQLLRPMKTNINGLCGTIKKVLELTHGPSLNPDSWASGRYCPTPTIIEAATALYSGHTVQDISRNDASAINLTQTSSAVAEIIRLSKTQSQKSVCFVTGVPGAGKTLVGLNIATSHINQKDDLYSVFLSGNGPLVSILREALARDKVQREKEQGRRFKKGQAVSEVKAFVQNVHHFRDDCLLDASRPPIEHVALFDEAQRAWNKEQTSRFMQVKKKRANFDQSEPEFLISCLNRHPDWAVVVCLVGGGQEINTGEAGISEWIAALMRSFPDWHVYISSRLTDSEYGAGQALKQLAYMQHVTMCDELHLAVSMRSFRAENVSLLVKQLLDLEESQAQHTLRQLSPQYPIVLTRDLHQAKQWLREKARGSERYGMVASSQAQRLKPHAIDVKSPMDPIHWFLDGKQDVRSSYYLEEVATEFHVQGLELDWACVTWDGDFRYTDGGWEHWSFCGDRWNRIRKLDRQTYLKNAYRVLLTRARQGMVIVVPQGDPLDPTRQSTYYDPTYDYLQSLGFACL